MKKKLGYIVLLAACIIIGAVYFAKGRAESVMDSGVLKAYPAAVISRVYSITSRVALPVERQRKLAEYFQEKDRMANQAKERGEDPVVFAKYYTVDYDEIRELLEPEDFNRYILSLHEDEELRNYPLALKLRRMADRHAEELKLSKDQVLDLLADVAEIEESARSGEFNVDSAENEGLAHFLSEEQFREYFYLSSVPGVERTVDELMDRLRDAELMTMDDSAKVYQLLYPFEYQRAGGLAYYSFKKENKLYDRYRDSMACHQPAITILYDGHRNLHPWSWPLNILFHRKSLDLTNAQINSLVSMYRKVQEGEFRARYLKADDSDERFDRWQFEKTELVKVLNTLQIDNYLQIRNRKSAEENAQRDYEKLREYGLVMAQDSAGVHQELFDYRLRLQVRDEWVAIERSKKNEFAKRDIIDNRPELLKMLDEKIKADRERNVVRF